jgi:hypothetical protein
MVAMGTSLVALEQVVSKIREARKECAKEGSGGSVNHGLRLRLAI